MAKRYDLIVFDWDGTVMDSTAVISGSIQAACRDLGLDVPDDETARHVIGLGLEQALRYAVPDLPVSMYSELGVTAERTLMVGDTTHDVQMAQNAKVDVVAVGHGAHPPDRLQVLNPLALVEDFAVL